MEFLLYTLTAFIFLVFPDGKNEGVMLALSSVKNIVIATLFPMMVLTRGISGTPFMKRIEKQIEKNFLWRKLNLSSSLITPVITGILSGFPSSARTIEKLLEEKKITKKEASKALALSSAPSPAFVIGIAGKNFLHGSFLFLLSLSFSYFCVCKVKSTASKTNFDFSRSTFTSALSSSVSSALNVSGNIIFFTLVTSLFSFLPRKIILLLSAAAELGSGSAMLKNYPVLLSFLTGFGGISALCQVKSEAPKTDIKLYIKIRIASGVLLSALEFLFF